MNLKSLAMASIVICSLAVTAPALADDQSAMDSSMPMKDMPMKDGKMVMPADHQRSDLKKDKKCYDKHGKLMDKAAMSNGVKCRQTHGFPELRQSTQVKSLN